MSLSLPTRTEDKLRAKLRLALDFRASLISLIEIIADVKFQMQPPEKGQSDFVDRLDEGLRDLRDRFYLDSSRWKRAEDIEMSEELKAKCKKVHAMEGQELFPREIKRVTYYAGEEYVGLTADILKENTMEIKSTFTSCWGFFREQCKEFEKIKDLPMDGTGIFVQAGSDTLATLSDREGELSRLPSSESGGISTYREGIIISSYGFKIIGDAFKKTAWPCSPSMDMFLSELLTQAGSQA